MDVSASHIDYYSLKFVQEVDTGGMVNYNPFIQIDLVRQAFNRGKCCHACKLGGRHPTDSSLDLLLTFQGSILSPSVFR